MKQPAKKRGPGRPSMGPTTQLAIRFPNEMIEAVDEITAGRLDRPDRASVIRELVAEAIEIRRRGRKP